MAVRLGIGDDAAILHTGFARDIVLTCDAFLDGTHFLADVHPADSIGYKSLVRATSDLVAMGSTPRFFLLTLVLPAGRAGKWLDRFLQGMAKAARALGLRLVGGDTSRAAKVSIVITVIGEAARGRAILRSGARPGDTIYVSGTLGRAQLGLELIRNGLASSIGNARQRRRLLQPHLYPRIPLALGAWLARQGIASATMDISDGLSTDLDRLCKASGVGSELWAERIPRPQVPAVLSRKLTSLKLNPMEMALHGGDDYELLFTVPAGKQECLRGAPGYASLRPIGKITRTNQIILIACDGRREPLAPGGWDPFRS